MTQPSRAGWWTLLGVALSIVVAWPPDNDVSLLVKTIRWAVDPGNRLPRLPAQLGLGIGDDPVAVEMRDAEVRRYDEMNNRGGWARTRLKLKVATDPLNASTERQLLLAIGVIAAFVVWRLDERKSVTAEVNRSSRGKP